MDSTITGRTAADIADSVRGLHEVGALRAGDPLPPVRVLADRLGVHRNTVAAAYGQLSQAGLVQTLGRGGTRIAAVTAVAQEGFAAGSVLRDIGTGNPDPERIPDISSALAGLAGRPVLYGEPVIDPELARWATAWMSEAIDPALPVRLTITSGAADAVDRLLAQAMTRDDAVALEDPCFLASLNTVRLGGYRPVPVPVDGEGMTVAGLRSALAAGVRAVGVHPPRPESHGRRPDRAPRRRAAGDPGRPPLRPGDRGRPLLHALDAAVPLADRTGPSPVGSRALGVEVPRTRHVPGRRSIRSRHGGAVSPSGSVQARRG